MLWRPRSSAGKIVLLGALYFAEGLPFGFQAKALPYYLREHGVSLAAIGLIGLLQLPWALKFLVAPFVEASGWARVGHRKSWILPTQALLVAASVAAAVVPLEETLLFGALLLAMNVLAATQDIAVDGLAVDLLAERDLGHGNAAQVAGYKVGMLASGGLLVVVAAELGSAAIFVGMAGLLGAVLVLVLLFDEPGTSAPRGAPRVHPPLAEVWRALGRAVTQPGLAGLVAVILTYKLGETMVDAMFTPFVRDQGYSLRDVAFWMFIVGGLASIGGSIAGGALASRVELGRALRITAAARVLPLAAITLLALVQPTWPQIVAVSLAEEVFGGALTTVVFATMMSRVDRSIGAAHFTAFACLEVGGKSLARLPSGLVAGKLGYAAVFALGAAISLAFVALVWLVTREGRSRPRAPS